MPSPRTAPETGLRTGPDPIDARAEPELAESYPARPAARASLPASQGWGADLIGRLPAEAGPVELDEDGAPVRYVQQIREQAKADDGVIYNVVEDVPRYIALTQEQAKAESATGRETDWWNGETWFRRGYKPEKELWIRPVERRTHLVRADEATQALFERDALRRAAAEPHIPSAPTETKE